MEELRTVITPDRLDKLRRLAQFAPDGGLAAEVGVYQGGSLRLIAQTLGPRRVFGCDTFAGLPAEDWRPGELHEVGEFADTSLDAVAAYVADLPNVQLVPGVFPASAPPEMAAAAFAFVHIDTDFYWGVRRSLEFFWPRLVRRGRIVFDDYQWSQCPGVVEAIKDCGLEVYESARHQAFAIKR